MNACTSFQINATKMLRPGDKRILEKETQITIQTTFVNVKSLYKFQFIELSVCRCCEISAHYDTRKMIDGIARLHVMHSYRQTFVVASNAFFVIVHS